MARQVTLVIETGSVVPDSNSFVSEDAIVSYAAMRGVTLPFATDTDKDAVAVLGIKAMDYLKTVQWKGEVADVNQTTPWPRKNLGVTPSFPENAVPQAVKEAQLQLALYAEAGVTLIPTSSGAGFLIKEKIGPIENMYSEKVGVSVDGMPLFPGIDKLLDFWILGTYDGFVPVRILSVGGSSHGC